MKANLFELNIQELKISTLIKNLSGTMEENDVLLNKLGIFTRYNNIFNSYSKLAFDNLEALKRAIFLQWYAVSEPRCFTGIGDLDLILQQDNISLLNDLISQSRLDTEFVFMLIYYNIITEWYFQSFKNTDNLLALLKSDERLLIGDFKISYMKDRGSMGEYWNSLDRNLLYEN